MSTEPLHLVPVLIRLRGCGKHLNGQRVLESMDLDIAAGEAVVLLDPPDRGKTITLCIVAGLEASGAGDTVYFGDGDVTTRPVEHRRVGMVFQSYTLFPNLNVRGNVEYGLRTQRRQNGLSDTQISARANTLLEMMHPVPYTDRGVAQFLGGQRQRVALTCVLVSEPRVLLFDEPFAAFDVKLRKSVRAEMGCLLCGLGITMVHVTHDQEEAMALIDRIAVIEAGHTTQIGMPREIYFQPANRHVAGSIGIMNRLDGTREDGALVCAGGRAPVSVGDGNTIFLRPGDAVLADPAQAALKGMVELTLSLGFRTRVRVVGVSAMPLFIGVSGRQQFAPGHAVGLDAPVDCLLTLQA